MCHLRCVLKTATLVLCGHHRRTSEHSTAQSTSMSLREHLLGPRWWVWSGAIICSISLYVCQARTYYIVKDRRGWTGECVCVCMYMPICNTSWDILTSSKEEIWVRLECESHTSGRAVQTGEQQPTDQSATEVCWQEGRRRAVVVAAKQTWTASTRHRQTLSPQMLGELSSLTWEKHFMRLFWYLVKCMLNIHFAVKWHWAPRNLNDYNVLLKLAWGWVRTLISCDDI